LFRLQQWKQEVVRWVISVKSSSSQGGDIDWSVELERGGTRGGGVGAEDISNGSVDLYRDDRD
jgi:hypothetical protein